MNWDAHRWRVTRRTLPSGRVVDIVVAKEPEPPAKPTIDLTRCPDAECPGTKVIPVQWSDLDPGGWCLIRRCPDCNRWWHGHHSHDTVVVFDDALRAGTDQLIADLEGLSRRNMAEWGARFVSALNHDALLPIDF